MRDMKTRIAKQIIHSALAALRGARLLLSEPEIPYGFVAMSRVADGLRK